MALDKLLTDLGHFSHLYMEIIESFVGVEATKTPRFYEHLRWDLNFCADDNWAIDMENHKYISDIKYIEFKE